MNTNEKIKTPAALLSAALLLGSFAIVGCEQAADEPAATDAESMVDEAQGAAEDAGEAVEDAAEDAADAVEDATEEAGDALEDATGG